MFERFRGPVVQVPHSELTYRVSRGVARKRAVFALQLAAIPWVLCTFFLFGCIGHLY